MIETNENIRHVNKSIIHYYATMYPTKRFYYYEYLPNGK